MAAITTAAAGDWDAGGTWTGGVKPALGDTATLNHNVTVDTSEAVGTSPVAGTVVLTISTGVTLTIAAGGTLNVAGDTLLSNNSTVDVQGGGTWRFDASAAASPSTTRYVCQIGSAHGTTSLFKVTGTSGSRGIVNSVTTSSAAAGRFTDGGFLQGGNMRCDFATFTNIGDASNNGFNCSVGAAGTTYFRDCIFDTCGKMGSTFNINATANFDMQRCCWKNSPGKVWGIGNVGYTSGTRLMHQNVFDQTLDFFSPAGWTVTENYFDSFFSTTAADFVSFANNHVRMTSALSGTVLYGPVTNNYFLFDQTGYSNPHFIQCQSTMAVTGNIFEFAGTDGTGDCISFGSAGSASTITIEDNLVLPNSAGETSGTLLSALGNANITFSADHNTFHTGTAGGIAVGETYAGHTGMCTSMRSNIGWDTSARGYFAFDSGGDDAVSDLVSAANLNYNCAYNTLAGSDGHGVNNLEYSSGTPGANNVDQNPQFFDATRDATAYDAAQGGAGTTANLRTEMKKRNDTGFNSAYTPTALVAWVKDGFRVGNSALRNAGHDGTTIGAQDYFSARNPGAVCLLGAG